MGRYCHKRMVGHLARLVLVPLPRPLLMYMLPLLIYIQHLLPLPMAPYSPPGPIDRPEHFCPRHALLSPLHVAATLLLSLISAGPQPPGPVGNFDIVSSLSRGVLRNPGGPYYGTLLWANKLPGHILPEFRHHQLLSTVTRTRALCGGRTTWRAAAGLGIGMPAGVSLPKST